MHFALVAYTSLLCIVTGLLLVAAWVWGRL